MLLKAQHSVEQVGWALVVDQAVDRVCVIDCIAGWMCSFGEVPMVAEQDGFEVANMYPYWRGLYVAYELSYVLVRYILLWHLHYSCF